MKSAREKILRRRILIVALCVIAIIIGIIVCVQIKKSRPHEYKKNRKQLEKLEQVDISDTEKQWEALEGANQKTEIDASKRNQYGVVELDSATLKKAFEGVLVVGDSFSEALDVYGILDAGSVVYKRGASVNGIDELIEKVISMKPSTVIMEFGCNDLQMYNSDIDGFIEKYKSQIRKIKDALPDTMICVNSILPMTEASIKEKAGREKQPQYNEAIQKMCEDEGYLYIDSCFIVEADSSLYEQDGIHMKKAYYEQWLSYIVEKAGL